MREEYREIAGGDSTHARFFGGELVLGAREGLGLLLDACHDVQERMERAGKFSQRGDEFFYYAADALGILPPVTDGSPYIARCWTGRYYSVPRWEDYAVLHLPSEKVYAFPKAFHELSKARTVNDQRFMRWCGLRPSRRPIDPVWVLTRLLDRVGVRP